MKAFFYSFYFLLFFFFKKRFNQQENIAFSQFVSVLTKLNQVTKSGNNWDDSWVWAKF